jgi:hypothetical protein
MALHRNEFGMPQYPDNDARRLLILLASIDLLERPTASALADLTSHDKESIDEEILDLQEQFGVVIHRVGEVYYINSWGEVLNREGMKRFLKIDSDANR